MATSFAKESIEMIREDHRRREDLVLQETHTIQLRRQIFELASEHCRGWGEGEG